MSYNVYRREYTIGNLFNDLFEDSYVKNKIPPVDILEDSIEYVIEAEIPSYSKEEVKISLDKHVLTIAAKKHNEENERHYLIREIRNSGFSRSFKLPEDADEKMISASADNGILRISIPKKKNESIGSIDIKIN